MSIKRLTKADRPLSFGCFKPVGHVVVALPGDAQAEAAVAALLADGFDAEDILQYSAAEEGAELDALLGRASSVGGFGYELPLMRLYRDLARDGCAWLVVYAPDDAHAARVALIAGQHGARVAERYHRLVVEDLLH
jgi:hypothetical protein